MMSKFLRVAATALAFSSSLSIAAPTSTSSAAPVSQTDCNGQYTYNELAGYGFLPGDATDKFSDTSGGIGSSAAIDKRSWVFNKKTGLYTGVLYALPDRGWNTQGTINYIHTEASGNCVATYIGDGFGGPGHGGTAISIDAEGLVLSKDGEFWISDEYGPYIYHFNAAGLMIGAIRPPEAILPLRNGSVSFSANSPPRYDANKTVIPGNPTQGRQNNQGFEGLTIDKHGKTLFVLLQSATHEDGGDSAATRRNTRFLQYSIAKKTPEYIAEYVVQLPTFKNTANATRVAAQSEVHYISDSQFFVLARDSGAGHDAASSTSLYRYIDVFDISKATNVKGLSHDAFNTSIASRAGVLNANITSAKYCSFIDFNINSQLNRFGVHNGGARDAGLLNEKWESMVLLEAEEDGEYYLFTFSDNDFITQNGFINFGKNPYQDASGYNLDNQALVFKVTLPKGAMPLVG